MAAEPEERSATGRYECQGQVVQPLPWWLLAVHQMAPVALTIAHAAHWFGGSGAVGALWGAYVVLSLFVWYHARRGMTKRTLVAASEGLSVDGRPLLRRGSFRPVGRAQVAHGAQLQFERTSSPKTVVVTLRESRDAERVLDALGMTAIELPNELRTRQARFTSFAIVAAAALMYAAFAALLRSEHGLVTAIGGALVAIAVGLVAVVARERLDRSLLMRDGLRMSSSLGSSRWLGLSPRFISFGEIASVEQHGATLRVRTRKQTQVLRFESKMLAFEGAREIESARERAQAVPVVMTSALSDVAASGEHGSNEARARRLAGLARGQESSYRSAPIADDEGLRQIIRSPAFTDRERVAAAIALTARNDAAETDVRKYAWESGSPAIERALLRVAAATDEADLAGALDEVDPAVRDARHRSAAR